MNKVVSNGLKVIVVGIEFYSFWKFSNKK